MPPENRMLLKLGSRFVFTHRNSLLLFLFLFFLFTKNDSKIWANVIRIITTDLKHRIDDPMNDDRNNPRDSLFTCLPHAGIERTMLELLALLLTMCYEEKGLHRVENLRFVSKHYLWLINV